LNKSIDCANQAADSLFMPENWVLIGNDK